MKNVKLVVLGADPIVQDLFTDAFQKMSAGTVVIKTGMGVENSSLVQIKVNENGIPKVSTATIAEFYISKKSNKHGERFSETKDIQTSGKILTLALIKQLSSDLANLGWDEYANDLNQQLEASKKSVSKEVFSYPIFNK